MLLWKINKSHTHTHTHAHAHMHTHTQILRVETHGLIGELWFYCVVSDSDILWGTKRFQVMTWVVEASADTRFLSSTHAQGRVSSSPVKSEALSLCMLTCFDSNDLFSAMLTIAHVCERYRHSHNMSENQRTSNNGCCGLSEFFFFFFFLLWWSSIILE